MSNHPNPGGILATCDGRELDRAVRVTWAGSETVTVPAGDFDAARVDVADQRVVDPFPVTCLGRTFEVPIDEASIPSVDLDDRRVEAVHGDGRYRSFVIVGGDGPHQIEICVWPQSPTDPSCA